MTNVIPSVGVLIIRDGKVLLVRHGEKAGHVTGTYGLPSGKIEESEDARTAAARELEEETGLVTTVDDLIDYPSNHFVVDIKRKDGSTKRFDWKVFVCKRYSGELRATEETTPEWVEIARLDEYNLLPNVKDVIFKEIQW